MASNDFPPPLIILSPPRSFSSVVSTMLGEHPQMYGFPELHLFLGSSVRQIIDIERETNGGICGSHGLLRALAQLHDGIQTEASFLRAAAWLVERIDWSTKKLLDHLFAEVSPLLAVEKSPPTAFKPEYLERAYAYYPDAYYLHLTRHPLSSRSSLKEFLGGERDPLSEGGRPLNMDKLVSWHYFHSRILEFTSTLPPAQTMRVKGEDVLSEPDVFLPQIAGWLGLRTDQDAVEAMKHPELSPYAFCSPAPARFGNDPKFLRSPALRPGKIRQPSLERFFSENPALPWFGGWVTESLDDVHLQTADSPAIQTHVAELAGLLGYW